MPIAQRISINLLTRNIADNIAFYQALCGFQIVHQEAWYVVLAASPDSQFQLGLIDWVSEFVPRAARGEPQGAYLEVVVEDVAGAVEAIRPFGTEIIEEPTTFGPLTRAVLRDLDGHVIDVVSPGARYTIPPRRTVA
ncbi:VOC family protein [Devosia sp. 1566]|uniref:VOC family protein n=1 Tax=Devosia sp. 1566 TaxID=2499144 RepID=UPI000FD8EBDF|nr:VOC family protein [Devosia sp. 1566]